MCSRMCSSYKVTKIPSKFSIFFVISCQVNVKMCFSLFYVIYCAKYSKRCAELLLILIFHCIPHVWSPTVTWVLNTKKFQLFWHFYLKQKLFMEQLCLQLVLVLKTGDFGFFTVAWSAFRFKALFCARVNANFCTRLIICKK